VFARHACSALAPPDPSLSTLPGMGAGLYFMVTKDVNQGARMLRQGTSQFRSNVKTMKGWAEEQAERCVPARRHHGSLCCVLTHAGDAGQRTRPRRWRGTQRRRSRSSRTDREQPLSCLGGDHTSHAAVAYVFSGFRTELQTGVSGRGGPGGACARQ